jgi:hypothetical protein
MFANFMALSCELVYTPHHRCDCRGYIDWLLDYATVATIDAVLFCSVCWRFAILDLNLGTPHLRSYRLRLVLRQISLFTLPQPLTKMSPEAEKQYFCGVERGWRHL